MELQRVEGSIGGGQDLDVELVEEGARTKLRALQLLCNDLVVFVRVFCAQSFGESKLIFQSVVEPETGRGAAEQIVVFCEDAPDLAGIGLLAAVDLRNAQGFERNTLRIEHAEDVVVGLNQEGGRIGKGFVESKPAWVGVTVRGDE